jgi:hypothetical protein
VDIDALITQAQEHTGLNDWGGATFREELHALAEDVRASNPNAHGLREFTKRVSSTLANRLALVADRKRFAEIERQQIHAPLVVLGLPRSGTTFLHALLAQDPASRSIAEWERLRPSPPPEESGYGADPRIAQARAETRVDPGMQERHLHDVELPVECGPAFLNYEFLSMGYDCRWSVPRYRIRMRRPIARAYEWHRRCLQHFQSRTVRRHWVLKSPEHLAHMRELFAVYPDARIVFTHRDPLQAVGSLASLVSYMRAPHYPAGDEMEAAKRVGPEMLDYWADALRSALAYRAECPARRQQFYDVAYPDLTADPMRIVHAIYEKFGVELTAEADARMRAWLSDFRHERYQERFGSHSYTLQKYGLQEAAVLERFGDYQREFIRR